MTPTEEQLLKLEIETAWEVFIDADPERHSQLLQKLDPKMFSLLILAYQHGYSDGAQSVFRSLRK